MIELRVVEADLLEASADAIFLTIDGAMTARAESAAIDRALGRIARAFARRHRGCDLVDEIEAQVDLPLALGKAAALELPEGSGFRHAVLLSMLAHDAASTSEEGLRAAMKGAFAEALGLCDTLKASSVATALLTGGWRVSPAAAMSAMLEVLAAAKPRGALRVSVHFKDDAANAAAMRALAKSFGF